ncbi:MAG: preprotein translocase subunit Sec61beta [Candidatus Woesearchaeota archaeon]
MAKKPKLYLPSGGGLVRYTEESEGKIVLTPKQIMIIIGIIILIEVILHLLVKF